MNDSDIEDLLRKYRPAGPPVEMRQRILATVRVPRIWPWASAAAALLVMALTLRLAAGNLAAGAPMNVEPPTSARIVEDLTTMLGGDTNARELAEFIVFEQEVRREVASGGSEQAADAEGVQR